MQAVRMSKREKQERIDKIQWDLAEMRRSSEILAYLNYNQLPYAEQKKIQEMWELYYDSARESTMAKRFFSQKAVFVSGDILRVKEIAVEAANDRERMSEPAFTDPSIYQRGETFIKYRRLKKTLSDLGVDEYSLSAQEAF